MNNIIVLLWNAQQEILPLIVAIDQLGQDKFETDDLRKSIRQYSENLSVMMYLAKEIVKDHLTDLIEKEEGQQ